MTRVLYLALPALAAGLMLSVPHGFSQNQLPAGTEMPESPRLSQPDAGGLSSAEDKIAQQDFAAAQSLIQSYLQAHPNDARALYDLGYTEQAQQQPAAAEASYRKAIAADPRQFESRLALGMMLASQGNRDEARKELTEATQLNPSPPDPAVRAQAFRALAALDRSSDPAAARTALLAALRLSTETPEDLLLTAQIAEAADDPATAEQAYRRLIREHPATGVGRRAAGGLAHLLISEQKYPEAEQVLKSALKATSKPEPAASGVASPGDSSDQAALEAQLATALIDQGKKKEALPVLQRLEVLEPGNPSVDQMLADAYAAAGYPEKAKPLYARLAAQQPNDPDALFAQGKNLVDNENYVQAQQIFERVVKLKPDDGDAWSGLAFAAFQNEQYSEAIQALTMRAKFLSETPATSFLWAISYDNLHQAKAASLYYRKFLASDAGKLPDQEWQARQRLKVLEKEHR